MFPQINILPLSYYNNLYSLMLQYGYLYLISFVLAILVYFHALFEEVEPALTWAFLSFIFPFIGALLYLIYFICSWKNLCVSRKEKEKAREVIKKWEDTPITEERKKTREDMPTAERKEKDKEDSQKILEERSYPSGSEEPPFRVK